MLTRYLASLTTSRRVVHETTWRQKLGDALVDLLLVHRILVREGIADWYPCGGACGMYRPVLDEGRPKEKPYRAVCSNDLGCSGVQLAASQLTLLGHSFSALVDVLCGAFAIERAAHPEVALTRNVHRLGTTRRNGVVTDVFLAIAPEEELFPLFLATRSTAGRASWILATTLRWVPDAVLAMHGPGARVEITALADRLAIAEGKLVAVAEDVHAGAAADRTALASGAVLPAPAVAVLSTREGTRALSRDEHNDAITHAAERFDLFVDTTVVRAGRRAFCRGGWRDEQGRFHATQVLPVRALAVAEFIARAQTTFVLPEELDALKDHDAAQTFAKGWTAVDKTRRAIVRQKLGYRFAPPADLRWAVITPIEKQAANVTVRDRA